MCAHVVLSTAVVVRNNTRDEGTQAANTQQPKEHELRMHEVVLLRVQKRKASLMKVCVAGQLLCAGRLLWW